MAEQQSNDAYQVTRQWLEQTPPGFLYPKVVPSIVNLRDLILEPLHLEPNEEHEISLNKPGKGKEALAKALERLEGLEKEEANLIYASPWTVPLTQIAINQAIASPQQALEQLQACSTLAGRKVCQYPFKKNDIVWMCRTCQKDATAAQCHDCYQAADHEGHDVAFFHAQEGGCCDCGDTDAWDPAGFCNKHGDTARPMKAVCQKAFKRNDLVWMCRTCQADPTCAQCDECYNKSDHEGHDVAFFHSEEGGCCDCGDPDAWDPKGFCSDHGPPKVGEEGSTEQEQNPEDLLPGGIVPRVRGIVPGIMDWMVQKFVTTTKLSSKRTMLPMSEAESTLGIQGRQGHGLYIVLQADDIHTQEDYTIALREFFSSIGYIDDTLMNKLVQTLVATGQMVVWGTMEIATELGRDQTLAWFDGNPAACSAVASILMKRVVSLKKMGFYSRIMTLKELQQEQQAIAIVQWLSALAFSCDPLSQTVATYTNPKSHLNPLLEADFTLSSRFTKAWYSLLLTLLAVPAFKYNLGAAYCETYENLTEDCAKGKGSIDSSAYSLSVQFLNRDTYVLYLVTNHNLLSKLGRALLATLKAAEDKSTGRLDCNHIVLVHRRYSPCISDLYYVINVKGMKRLLTCKGGTFLNDFISGLSLAQGIDTYNWRHWDLGHVEEESVGWYGAFNLALAFGGVFERLLSFEDDEVSPVQDPSSSLSSGLLSCVQLCMKVLTEGIANWQNRMMKDMYPKPHSAAVDAHKRRSASLPFSTIAANRGCAVAFRQLSVAQVDPFSLHLPLHRFFASCLREVCLRPYEKGVRVLLEMLYQSVPQTELDNIFFGLLEFPVLVMSRAAQVRAGLWKRNGPGLSEQVLKYSDPSICKSMRDSDLILMQFAVLKQRIHQSPTPRPANDVSVAILVHLLLHRLGLFDFVGMSKAPSADPDAYEAEASKGFFPRESGEANSSISGLVLPWTYTPARDAADCRGLVEELLYLLIVMVTELPPPPPVDQEDFAKQAEIRMRREIIHKLAASPKTHKELADYYMVLSFRDNTSLDEVGKSINPDDAATAMLDKILSDVAERKASRSRHEPDKFQLLKSAWETYDPCFYHISIEGHQTAAENRPTPSEKNAEAKGKMPFAPAMPDAHPCFERLRRDITSDVSILAVLYKVFHIHCRGTNRPDLVDLRIGRLAYDNDAKSEICLARAVHLLTLGCYAWENASKDPDKWREAGGGSPGSIFFDNEAAPTVSDWISAVFLADPAELLDCSWYSGEETILSMLRRLALDGGATGIFVVQDPAVQAGAAFLCEFALKHSQEAAKMVGGRTGATKEFEELNESELDRKMRMAKEKAVASMNAQAAKFASMMSVELDEEEDGNTAANAPKTVAIKQESDFERRKREAKERALQRINKQAANFASSAGIEISSSSGEARSEGDVGEEETDFERKKRLAKEKALQRINNQASKFASSVGIELEREQKAETELEKRKRLAKERALARMNAQASKFAALNNIDLEGDEPDAKLSASGVPASSQHKKLLRERPQCIICSDSDAECFVAFSQGSTVLKGGGGPYLTDDARMAQVRRHVGTYVSLCGHAVHSDCSASYLAKVQQNPDQASSSNGEFRCPLCQRPSNCLVPLVDVNVGWIETPSANLTPMLLSDFLESTPYWISLRSQDFSWDGQSAFICCSEEITDSGDNPDGEMLGEIMVLKSLMEQICGITYDADTMRLGSDTLRSDLGEFRHYVVEKNFYGPKSANHGANASWPDCLYSEDLSESKRRSMSREKFISQLLMAIQCMAYSLSCEVSEARQNIQEVNNNGDGADANELGIKPILSKFGIGDVICSRQSVVMPQPSATEDEGSQPFNGRIGRLRNLAVALMAASGAVGEDLVQIVLSFPSKVDADEEDTTKRAPVAYPILLGNVLTHTVAAFCASAGRVIAPASWKKCLKRNVEYQNFPAESIDCIVEDCVGFMKLGLLARVLQAICKETKSASVSSVGGLKAICALKISEYDGLSDDEKAWMQSCHTLVVCVVGEEDDESSKLDEEIPTDFWKSRFRDGCNVAASASATFLNDAGTILQVLVPGIMARYSKNALSLPHVADSNHIGKLKTMMRLFNIEDIDVMLESKLVGEVVRHWYKEAIEYTEEAKAGGDSHLLSPLPFRSWDWPLTSVADYLPQQLASPMTDKSTPSKKTTPLLGGYSSDVQSKTNMRPCVEALPSSYMDLYAKVGKLLPDAERTALCLICGEALDASGKGECTRHSFDCGAGTGICFLLQDCQGLLLHRGEGSFIHSIYVDKNGDTPRGRPLYLNHRRYSYMQELWRGHLVRQQIITERENTQQGTITGYY